jgi:hypothetical protein
MAPDDAPPEDRRRAERVPVNAQFGALDGVHYVRDLSERGVFLHIDDVPAIGSLVDLCFTVIVDDPVVLKARGRVVRHQKNPNGVGVEFTRIDDGMKDRIREVVDASRPQDSGPSLEPEDAHSSENEKTIRRRAEDLLAAHNLEIEQIESLDLSDLDEGPSEAADTLMHLKAVDLEILDEDDQNDEKDEG